MSCQQVPTTPAFNPYPRSVQVGEFEVAIGGGIWVAISGRARPVELKYRWVTALRHQVANNTSPQVLDESLCHLELDFQVFASQQWRFLKFSRVRPLGWL